MAAMVICVGTIPAYGVHECVRPVPSTAVLVKPKGGGQYPKADFVETEYGGNTYYLVRNNTTGTVNFTLEITTP